MFFTSPGEMYRRTRVSEHAGTVFFCERPTRALGQFLRFCGRNRLDPRRAEHQQRRQRPAICGCRPTWPAWGGSTSVPEGATRVDLRPRRRTTGRPPSPRGLRGSTSVPGGGRGPDLRPRRGNPSRPPSPRGLRGSTSVPDGAPRVDLRPRRGLTSRPPSPADRPTGGATTRLRVQMVIERGELTAFGQGRGRQAVRNFSPPR